MYAPCQSEGKLDFLEWLKDYQVEKEMDWLVLGDFNLIRRPENRNKEGANLAEILMFNEVISDLGLNEIFLQGRKYTWSNKQTSPLLEKLDWAFTSNSWVLKYPNTTMTALDMSPSDHCPCIISISSHIPKSGTFRFENYWLRQENFGLILNQSWANPTNQVDPAKNVTAKFKNLRKNLKQWQASIPNLKTSITNIKSIIFLLEILEEFRDLSLLEWNFRELLRIKLNELLEQQKIYWRQRGPSSGQP